MVICVLYLEEDVNVILGGAVLHARVGILAHHVIDWVHYVRHLLGNVTRVKEMRQHEPEIQGKTKRWTLKGCRTSLVMQPSLLRSYRLKAQLSLSVMEPLKMMDRLMTKSYRRKRKTTEITEALTRPARIKTWRLSLKVSPQSSLIRCCGCQRRRTGNARTYSNLEQREQQSDHSNISLSKHEVIDHEQSSVWCKTWTLGVSKMHSD